MYLIKKLIYTILAVAVFFTPSSAHANGLIDAINLAPFVPLVLDSIMMVATGVYEFFVTDGNHIGIIYILIWCFLGITLVMSIIKMYIPKSWGEFFGWSNTGEMANGVSPMKIIENIMKPGLRVIIASIFLLQLKPVYMTQWLINPFLQLGSIYTHVITETINESGVDSKKIECPRDILEKEWLSPESCEFLIQPVYDLARANNKIAERGFGILTQGLKNLMSLIGAGNGFLDIITGLLLIFTFIGCNLFMSLLVIQGIFNFGAALIIYPFNVLMYVAKPNDKWLDIWPAFSGITKALQQLIVTMIACAFMLCINLAIVRALFNFTQPVFVVAAGGSSVSNVPQSVPNISGFGEHSVTWLAAILTFYLMFKIFEITNKQLNTYVGSGMDGLYNNLKGDVKNSVKIISDAGKNIGKGIGWIKGK
ncbi:MAG: hypothetical protein J6K82_03460 [Alphaproteobacteria bacterium]|nr:hypothetical protein [Alphaproteobacteria bacterium]